MSAGPRHELRRVAALAGPAALHGLVSTVLIFTDRLILGRYSPDALASMQVSGVLGWSVVMIGTAFTAGVIALVGRAIGAGDRARANQLTGASVAFGAAAGLATLALGWPLIEGIAELLAGGDATSPEVRGMAVTYLSIAIWAAPPVFFSAAGMVALQAGGDTRTPAVIAVFTGVANLAVSWALVFGIGPFPEWGVAGAAAGVVVAIWLEGLAIGWVLWRGRGVVGLARPRLAPLGPLLRISVPAYGERIMYQAGFLIFAAFIGRLGDVSMAAHQALMAIESLGFIGADAFGIAAGALVAQGLGAKDPDDANRAGWWSTFAGVGVLSVVGVFFFVAAEPLVALFTDDPEVIALGVDCLRIAAVAQPLMAAVSALAGALRGAGDTRTPMIAAIVGPLGVRLAASWYLAFELGWGLWGIWIGSTADWAVRAVWLGVVYARGRWRDIEVPAG